jgi:hypothetical protein
MLGLARLSLVSILLMPQLDIVSMLNDCIAKIHPPPLMSPIAERRILRPAVYLALLLLPFMAGVTRGEVIGSMDDLWDVSNGTVVTATSGIRVGFDATDMFGGENSTWTPGETIFDDDRPPGFVHYIEWQTPTPVRIGQIDLYARGDSPLYLNRKRVRPFCASKARSPGSAYLTKSFWTSHQVIP